MFFVNMKCDEKIYFLYIQSLCANPCVQEKVQLIGFKDVKIVLDILKINWHCYYFTKGDRRKNEKKKYPCNSNVCYDASRDDPINRM